MGREEEKGQNSVLHTENVARGGKLRVSKSREGGRRCIRCINFSKV